jgi:hypothetical protein
MTLIQRFFLAVLPKRWADSMRAESESWQIRCCTCGASRSVWEAGGIRWKAASIGKRRLVRCPQCKALRWAAIELEPYDRGMG